MYRKARAARDDAVTVVIRVAGECHVELVAAGDQGLHREGRRGVHANAAIPVERHEAERGVDRFAHDRQIEPVTFGYPSPIVNAGAAERIHADSQSRRANRIEVDHLG